MLYEHLAQCTRPSTLGLETLQKTALPPAPHKVIESFHYDRNFVIPVV